MRRLSQKGPITLWAAALLTGFLAISCSRQPQAMPPPQVPEVATVTIHSQKVMLTTELPGRTSAYRMAEIRPQVNGIIQKRLYTEGSDVKAGQVLYQIDPAPFKAALDNAKAALSRVEANLPALRLMAERYKEALTEHAVSQQDYDNAEASLKQAEADTQYWKAMVETARINLSYCNVTAPISGRIGRSNVTEGAIVTAYQAVAMATIQQLDPIYVDVPQSTTELLRLRNRLKEGHLNQNGSEQSIVKLILEDTTVYPQEGKLQFSDITVDPTTGSVILRAVFPNPEGVLLPGMFVRARIKEGVSEQAILVPQQGVSRDRKGNPFALIVNAESKTVLHPLVLDRAMGAEWLVSKGLATGDRVIVTGAQMLRPGTVVNAVPLNNAEDSRGVAANLGTQLQTRMDGGA